MSEPKKWSVYFQNPEYLERTRLFLIPEDIKPLVRKWCGIRDGMKILDVGCGTGYFTRLLCEGGENVTASGLDLEEPFIEYAKQKALEAGLNIRFTVGNALELPYEDNTFDLVTSHTFLTNIPDPPRAMAEMIRVCRDGGTVASVTAMSFMPSGLNAGQYPAECGWYPDYRKMAEKFWNAYFRIDPLQNRTAGIAPKDAPRLFADCGLKHICAYPVGKFFSLSNAAVPAEQKLLYIDLWQVSEEKKLDTFMALPEMAAYATQEDAETFRALIRAKSAWHRAHTDDNSVWDWQGDANLLITGTVEKNGVRP